MTIQSYEQTMRPQLEPMMVSYMTELGTDIPEAVIRTKLFDVIHSLLSSGILRIDLAMDGKTAAGFSVYQIDTPASDWCKRPGWGFIREFYISPAYRRTGCGRQLALHTESALREMGAESLYLTSTGAIPFWQRCGWMLTDELCSNGQYILEK